MGKNQSKSKRPGKQSPKAADKMNGNGGQDKDTKNGQATLFESDGGTVKINNQDNAVFIVEAGKEFKGNLKIAAAGKGGTIEYTQKDHAKINVRLACEAQSEQEIHSERNGVNEIEESKEPPIATQNDVGEAEKMIHLTIEITEKRETKRKSFLPSQKVADLRKAIEKEYKGIKFSIFGPDEKKLIEERTFQQNKIQTNHKLTLTAEVLVSSNNTEQRAAC